MQWGMQYAVGTHYAVGTQYALGVCAKRSTHTVDLWVQIFVMGTVTFSAKRSNPCSGVWSMQ